MLSQVQKMLQRPTSERLREHRYRFSQCAVFGLPVLGLQWFGTALGGPEAERWVAIFQAILTGWIIYVAATGMLIEGVLAPRPSVLPDFFVALAAVVLYLISLVSVLHVFIDGSIWFSPVFHWSVILLAAWSGTQWWRLSSRSAPSR